MSKTLFYNNIKVHVIINKKLKHSYIQIIDFNEICIKTAKNSKRFIYDLVKKKYFWILKHMEYIKDKSKQIILTNEILLLGKVLNINEIISKKIITDKQKMVQIHDNIYRLESKKYIPLRIRYFSNIMNLSPSNVLFRKMKRRWGSCNSKQEITFNIYLIKLPKELIDYVVAHEMAHLKYLNHSKQFYNFLELFIKNSKKLKQQIYKFNLL